MPSPAHALVTGASSGIGATFARELAARGHALVLTARRGDRLEALAAELRSRHRIDVRCIALDLAEADAPRRLVEILEREGLAIDWLINNAGYGVPGSLVDSAWPTHQAFFRVLMIAPIELCHRLLPGMRERGRGTIINVASLAAFVPAPSGFTLYGASKAFLVRASQALAMENRKSGIRVLALCPGFTRSEFHDVTGTRDAADRMPPWMWMDAESVVRDALDAVERGDIVRISGRLNRWIARLFAWLPRGFALRMIERRNREFRPSPRRNGT